MSFSRIFDRPPRKALNLDYDDIADYAPAVVFCVISGYGFEGPESERPGFDWAAYWAAAGIGSAISEGYEVPIAPRPAIGDHSTAMSAAAGVCAALVARAQTGRGQQVHTSLVANGAFPVGLGLREPSPGLERLPLALTGVGPPTLLTTHTSANQAIGSCWSIFGRISFGKPFAGLWASSTYWPNPRIHLRGVGPNMAKSW